MEPKEEIKQRLPIEVVIGEYVELKRAGRNYKGLSPFSAEKTPSFIVSPEKNIWHDFSSGKGGDIFSFVMEVEGFDFPAALKHLATKAGVELEEYSPAAKKDAQTKQTIFRINQLATKYFQASLLKNPAALEYLRDRGINKQAIKDFELGYGPNSSNGLVNLLQKNGFKDEDIEKAGVATRRGGQLYDIFRERITFPFISPNGEHLGFTGRLIKKDGFGPKYLNTPQTLVYNKSAFLYGLNLAKEAIRKSNQVIMLEGNLDVVSSNQAGIKEVVAASGTAITALQVRLIARLTENLIFCLDSDSAGVEATIRSLEITAKTDLKVSVATIPDEFKDADELLKSEEGLERWKLTIQQASDAYIWLIETLAKQTDLSSPGSKGSYAAKIIRILNLIENPVSQESYKKYLADKLDVSLEALDQLASAAPLKRFKEVKLTPSTPDIAPLNKLKLATDRFLSLLLQLDDPNTLSSLKSQLPPSHLPTEHTKTIYKHILNGNKEELEAPEIEDYTAELNLIHAQFLEFSPEETPLIELLNEQYLNFQEALREWQLQSLKQKLAEASAKDQNPILQKIHTLQSTQPLKLTPESSQE